MIVTYRSPARRFGCAGVSVSTDACIIIGDREYPLPARALEMLTPRLRGILERAAAKGSRVVLYADAYGGFITAQRATLPLGKGDIRTIMAASECSFRPASAVVA